jgi:membrane-associated PAP2 superfamily phosphatase
MTDRTSALSLAQLSMFRQQLARDKQNAAAHLHPIGDTSSAYVLKSLHFQWFQRYPQNQMERARQFQTL